MLNLEAEIDVVPSQEMAQSGPIRHKVWANGPFVVIVAMFSKRSMIRLSTSHLRNLKGSSTGAPISCSKANEHWLYSRKAATSTTQNRHKPTPFKQQFIVNL